MTDLPGRDRRGVLARRVDRIARHAELVVDQTTEVGRPFVIGGVPVVLDVLSQDEQIASRFDTVVELKPFKRDEFTMIVRGFDRMLPLRRPSCFRSDDDAVAFLFDHSQGFIGRLSNILHDACKIAIETKEESVTLDILKRIPNRSIRSHVRTSER